MMKRSVLIIALVVNIGTILMAQSSIRFNLGYAFPLGKELIGEEVNETYSGTSVKGVYKSYGAGFPVQVAFARTLKNSSFGYDLELGYLVGKKHKFTSTFPYGPYQGYETQRSHANSFQFAPSLTATAKAGKISIYSRMGPIFALTKMKFDLVLFDGYTYELGYEAKGGISVGFKGAMGIIFNPISKVQFFTEMNFTSLSCSPKEGKINEYWVGGADYLPSLSAKERKISFEKDYTYIGDAPIQTQTREKYSMSSLALQIGLRFVL